MDIILENKNEAIVFFRKKILVRNADEYYLGIVKK